MNNIKFYSTEENSVVIESSNLEDSIFKFQYKQAFKCLKQCLGKDVHGKNIIAFCGDRGEGKTSCMLTVKNILEYHDKDDFKNYLENIGFKENLKDLEIMDEIDPLFFDDNHNLLDLLLSAIYQKTNNYDKSSSSDDLSSHKRNIYRVLDKIKGYMCSLTKNREKLYDHLEELELLSGGIQLKKHLDKLFECYLDLVGKKKLVLFIDDLDLNMSNAYQMSEELRKYLDNDRIIIFLSCKIDQLEKIIDQNMSKPLGGSNLGKYHLGQKYLLKLIPNSCRINMPKVVDICDKGLELYDNHEDAEPTVKYDSIKEAVVKLIFLKTRYLFYNSKNSVSLIVPNNLRSLRQLIGILLNMEDFENNDKHSINKKRFKDFFYREWVKCLSEEDRDFADKLVNTFDTVSVNKMVVIKLEEKLKQFVPKEDEQSSFAKITNHQNIVYNVSFGDVMNILNYMERCAVDDELRFFVFFIKSFYSISLYEYYDMVLENTNTDNGTSSDIKGRIYKNESWFKQENDMQRLVNGSYFTYDAGEVLSNNRDYKVLDGKRILNIHQFISSDNKERMLNLEIFGDFEGEDQIFAERYKRLFHLAEFFALTIVRSIDSKKTDDVNDIDRKSAIPHYLKKFNPSIGFYVFDVLAPFYSMLNIEYAYSRFDSLGIHNFYETAQGFEWSLLNRMKERSQRDGEVGMEYLFSDSVIRNTEVWSAIREQIEVYRYGGHAGGNEAKRIKGLYDTIVKIGMSTYDINPNREYYKISFNFLKAISDELTQFTKEGYAGINLEDFNFSKEKDVKDIIGIFNNFVSHTRARTSKGIKQVLSRQKDLYTYLKEEEWNNIYPDNHQKWEKDEIKKSFETYIKETKESDPEDLNISEEWNLLPKCDVTNLDV